MRRARSSAYFLTASGSNSGIWSVGRCHAAGLSVSLVDGSCLIAASCCEGAGRSACGDPQADPKKTGEGGWSVWALRSSVVGSEVGSRCPAARSRLRRCRAGRARPGQPTQYKATKLGIPHVCGSLAEVFAPPGVEAVTIASRRHALPSPAKRSRPADMSCARSRRRPILFRPQELVDASISPGVVGATDTSSAGTRRVPRSAPRSRCHRSRRLATVVEYTPFLQGTDAGSRRRAGSRSKASVGRLGANGSDTLDQQRPWLGPYRSVSGPWSSPPSASAWSRTPTRRASKGDGVEVALENVGAAWTRWVRGGHRHGAVLWGSMTEQAWIADAAGSEPSPVPEGSAAVGAGGGGVTTSTRSVATSSANAQRPPCSGPTTEGGPARAARHPAGLRRRTRGDALHGRHACVVVAAGVRVPIEGG